MAAVTTRNLSEEAQRALKVRTARHNRSTEVIMRAILEPADRPVGRLQLGTALQAIGQANDISRADIEAMGSRRQTPLPSL